jgi:hypothetical protein
VLTIDGINKPGNFSVTGGSEPDSQFRGSYASTAQVGPTFNISVGGIPPAGTVPQNGQFEFTVDKQGELLGSIQDYFYFSDEFGIPQATPRGNAVVCRLRITNDGRFSGTINGYATEGKISKQVVAREITVTTETTPAPVSSPAPNPLPSPTVTKEFVVESSSGVSGNMEIAINGRTYIATFFASGGFTGGTA